MRRVDQQLAEDKFEIVPVGLSHETEAGTRGTARRFDGSFACSMSHVSQCKYVCAIHGPSIPDGLADLIPRSL